MSKPVCLYVLPHTFVLSNALVVGIRNIDLRQELRTFTRNMLKQHFVFRLLIAQTFQPVLISVFYSTIHFESRSRSVNTFGSWILVLYGSFTNSDPMLFRTKQMPGAGFEPTRRLHGTDFKSVAFIHSANPAAGLQPTSANYY